MTQATARPQAPFKPDDLPEGLTELPRRFKLTLKDFGLSPDIPRGDLLKSAKAGDVDARNQIANARELFLALMQEDTNEEGVCLWENRFEFPRLPESDAPQAMPAEPNHFFTLVREQWDNIFTSITFLDPDRMGVKIHNVSAEQKWEALQRNPIRKRWAAFCAERLPEIQELRASNSKKVVASSNATAAQRKAERDAWKAKKSEYNKAKHKRRSELQASGMTGAEADAKVAEEELAGATFGVDDFDPNAEPK